jgi:DnaJ-class molecular chaperone
MTDESKQCPECRGSRDDSYMKQRTWGEKILRQDCPACQGTGRVKPTATTAPSSGRPSDCARIVSPYS